MNLRFLAASALASLPVLAMAGGAVDFGSDSDGVQFGVNASFTLNNLGPAYDYSYSYKGMVAEEKTLPSFKVDAVVDIPIRRSLHILTGVGYSLKGDRLKAEYMDEKEIPITKTETYYGETYTYTDYEYEDVSVSEVEKGLLGYVEIPVQASFRIYVGSNAHIEVNFGPYFAVAVHGSEKNKIDFGGEKGTSKQNLFNGDRSCDGEYYDYKEEKEVKWDEKEYGKWEQYQPFKRFDCGLAFGVGFQVSHFYAGVSSEIGLTDIRKRMEPVGPTESLLPVKNRTLAISLGVRF